MEHVGVERHDRVALVTLVDRERRNAMTAAMVDEIVATFDALEADDDIGAVVITGEPPAFCSGADVAALGSLSEQHERRRAPRRSRSIYEGFLRVLRSPLPTVAAVNGPAVGAGLQPRARLRRSARRRRRPASTPASCASGSTPAAATRGCSTARSGPQAAAAMVLFGERDRRPPRRRDRPRLGLPSRRRAARAGGRVRGPGRRRAEGARRRDARRRSARRPGNPTSTPRSRPRSPASPGRSARGGFVPNQEY